MMFLSRIVLGNSIFQLLIPIRVLPYRYILIVDQNNLNLFINKCNIHYLFVLCTQGCKRFTWFNFFTFIINLTIQQSQLMQKSRNKHATMCRTKIPKLTK